MNIKDEVRRDWEKELLEETMPLDSKEIPFDPYIMETVLGEYVHAYRETLLANQEGDPEKWRLIDRLKAVAEKKLPHPQKECVMLLLTTGWSYREIARKMGMSRDTVRRSVDRSVPRLQKILNPGNKETFPSNENHSIKTKRFSIDTEEEKMDFQDFLNSHMILNFSYAISGDLKEVLVVYLGEKNKKKFH